MGFTGILLTVGVPVAIESGETQVNQNSITVRHERENLQVDLTQSENCSRCKNSDEDSGEMHCDGGTGQVLNFRFWKKGTSCLWLIKNSR